MGNLITRMGSPVVRVCPECQKAWTFLSENEDWIPGEIVIYWNYGNPSHGRLAKVICEKVVDGYDYLEVFWPDMVVMHGSLKAIGGAPSSQFRKTLVCDECRT